MKKLAAFIDINAKYILLVIALLCAAMVPGLKKIQFVNIPTENTISKPNKMIRDVLEVRKDFATNFRTIFISIESQGNHTILEPEILTKIKNLGNDLKKIPSIQSKSIISLATASDVRDENNEINTTPIMKSIPTNIFELEELKKKITENDLIYGRMISKDFKTTIIIAQASQDLPYEQISVALHATVKPYLNNDFLISAAGDAEIDYQLQKNIKSDASVFVLLAALLIIASFYIMFKTWKGAILLIAVMIAGIMMTMGLIGYYNKPIQILSAMLPVVIVVVGCSYAIHMFHSMIHVAADSPTFRDNLYKSLKKILVPLSISAITTFIGGISLLSFRLSMIEHFGLFLGVGTLITLILSIFLIPALYKTMWKPIREFEDSVEKTVMVGLHSAKSITHAIPVAGPITTVAVETITESVRGGFKGFFSGLKSGKILERMLRYVAKVVYKNPWAMVIVTLGLMGVAGYYTKNVSIGFDNISLLPNNYPIKQVMTRLNETFNGLSSFDLELDTGKPNGATDPAFLQKVAEFTEKVKNVNGITHVFSVLDLIQKVDITLNAKNIKQNPNHIPTSNEAVSQYLFLIESAGGGVSSSSLITSNHQKIKINLTSKENDTQRIEKIYNNLLPVVDEVFKDNVKTYLGGGLVTSVGVLQYMVWGKVKNILISLLLIFLFLAIVYKSTTQSLLSIITLPIGVILNFGLMGYMGIRLDMITAIITSFAMGIGVDFSIHFLSAAKKEYAHDKNLNTALEKAITGPGLAIALNAITTKIGFSALLLSQFTSIKTFSILMCFNMFTLAVAALTFLPALIKITRPAFVLGNESELKQKNHKLYYAGKIAFNTFIIAILFIGIYIIEIKAG